MRKYVLVRCVTSPSDQSEGANGSVVKEKKERKKTNKQKAPLFNSAQALLGLV